MFKRREPLSKLQHVRELFWPSMGWRRSARYIRLRIVRLADSTHSIAMGLACGVSISFNPLLGTHFVQAGLLAWLLRANIFAALIGTFAGNPWTFPFIWWGGIKFGSYIFYAVGLHASERLPKHLDFHVLMHFIRHDPMQLLVPWMIGGYLLGLLSMPVTYLVSYKMVRAGKMARARARSKARLYKIHKVAREVTE